MIARRALPLALLALAGCEPVDEALCGDPQTLLETTSRSEADGRVTWRTTRGGTVGRGQVVRVEDGAGRLLALDESPPAEGAPAGAAVRSIVMAWEDDRLTSATVLHLDSRGQPITRWQVALGYTADGAPERIEAVGQPPSRAVLEDLIGAAVPGPSDGELLWLLPLPGADLFGPLPADVDAIQLARPPGLPLIMAADVSAIPGGLAADWLVGGDGLEVPLRVEHVADGDGWIRTWVGNGALQTVSVGFSPVGDVPGDGDLVWRLEGAEFESRTRRTEPTPRGSRFTETVRREGRVTWRRVVDTVGETIEARTDDDGDGVDDQIRAQMPLGEGRTLDVIDAAPFGPVDLYRFVEVEGDEVRVHAAAPAPGKQLCAVGGGPVTLTGEPGARAVEGVPEGLPDPPPQSPPDAAVP